MLKYKLQKSRSLYNSGVENVIMSDLHVELRSITVESYLSIA